MAMEAIPILGGAPGGMGGATQLPWMWICPVPASIPVPSHLLLLPHPSLSRTEDSGLDRDMENMRRVLGDSWEDRQTGGCMTVVQAGRPQSRLAVAPPSPPSLILPLTWICLLHTAFASSVLPLLGSGSTWLPSVPCAAVPLSIGTDQSPPSLPHHILPTHTPTSPIPHCPHTQDMPQWRTEEWRILLRAPRARHTHHTSASRAFTACCPLILVRAAARFTARTGAVPHAPMINQYTKPITRKKWAFRARLTIQIHGCIDWRRQRFSQLSRLFYFFWKGRSHLKVVVIFCRHISRNATYTSLLMIVIFGGPDRVPFFPEGEPLSANSDPVYHVLPLPPGPGTMDEQTTWAGGQTDSGRYRPDSDRGGLWTGTVGRALGVGRRSALPTYPVVTEQGGQAGGRQGQGREEGAHRKGTGLRSSTHFTHLTTRHTLDTTPVPPTCIVPTAFLATHTAHHTTTHFLPPHHLPLFVPHLPPPLPPHTSATTPPHTHTHTTTAHLHTGSTHTLHTCTSHTGQKGLEDEKRRLSTTIVLPHPHYILLPHHTHITHLPISATLPPHTIHYCHTAISASFGLHTLICTACTNLHGGSNMPTTACLPRSGSGACAYPPFCRSACLQFTALGGPWDCTLHCHTTLDTQLHYLPFSSAARHCALLGLRAAFGGKPMCSPANLRCSHF